MHLIHEMYTKSAVVCLVSRELGKLNDWLHTPLRKVPSDCKKVIEWSECKYKQKWLILFIVSIKYSS